ncbi:MAG: GHKL domain-containing protein [Bdellovibrionales bacterium]|nr:GHKL domain-containing protein [Bdellovibrionales bacterium]
MTQKYLVNNLLRLEVAKKGQAATLAFFGFAIFSFIYSYGCVRFLTSIKGISAALFLLAVIRYFLYERIIKNNAITEKEWRATVWLITLNGLGYGLILWLAAYELKMTGIHFVVATTLIAGLVGSSIVTLAYFPILFIPFQGFLLLPQVGTILYFYFAEEINYLPLITLYLMYFAYQIKQFRSYHSDLVKLFTYQIELEAKNLELNESKNIIIEQTAQLVHASRLAVVGEMSAGVAHEINNPLTIISSSSQLISRFSRSQELDSMALNRYLGKINKSIDRISAIVKGLKYFAHQGEERVPKKSCNIQNIMDETTPFCMDHLNSLDIKFKVDEIPDVMINCHSVQISQVLINLLKNASDALADHMEEEKWISINFRSDQDYFYFIISNSGDKISHEVASRIFNPFFTTKDTGTGLGLSISQTIMKNHGGELYLDVNNYTNTTFVIKHPIQNYFY